MRPERTSGRRNGRTGRCRPLPAEVDIGKADAAYDKGVLTLTLPRMAGRETKKLPVH